MFNLLRKTSILLYSVDMLIISMPIILRKKK